MRDDGEQKTYGLMDRAEPLKPERFQGFKLAEMERFELSIPFWGIHDFQSCALDQLRDIST